MSRISKIIYFIVACLFFIVFNRFLSSLIVIKNLKLPSNPVFDFTLVQNEGAAFNIFEGAKLFLIVFSACAILGILYYVIKKITKLSGIMLFFTSILISGIFCNMFERIRFGYVVDFIKLKFIDFPVFNISDIFINLSVLAIVIIIIKNSYLKKI